METPPGFNLDQAIAAWLDGLEAQLRTTFAELRKNPISDEEAFLLARLRMGLPQAASANSRLPAHNREWAPRVFWLLFGVFAASSLTGIFGETFDALYHGFGLYNGRQPSSYIAEETRFLFQIVPAFIAGYWLIRGVPRFIADRLSTRTQVAVVCCLLFLFLKTLQLFNLLVIDGISPDKLYYAGVVSGFFLSSAFALCLIVPMIWLTPRHPIIKAPFIAAQKNLPANLIEQNSTSFNLNQAIATWRTELARQPGLVPDDLRELESHLRDGFSELRQNQLNDEEAFFLAHRRVGSAAPVAAEFAKATPRQVWAPRIFWLAFGLFIYEILPTISMSAMGMLDKGLGIGPLNWLFGAATLLGEIALVLIAAWWLTRGVPRFVTLRLATRAQVATIGAGLFLLANYQMVFNWIEKLVWLADPWFVFRPNYFFYSENIMHVIWQFCLLALMIWLTPRRVKTQALAIAA